ncbi:MAG: PTS sugar transporter subunit IIA [Tissierellia bacterium]|nr:PTS sugar transporter subunit IIA [Tissierellia bacterium]
MRSFDNEILKYLNEKKDYTPIKEVSSHFEVSEKTVRIALKRIEKVFKGEDIKYIIKKVPSKGVFIKAYDYNFNDKRVFMLIDILKGDVKYIKDLENKYYVSYYFLKNIINAFNREFKNKDIQIITKKKAGIIVKGNYLNALEIIAEYENDEYLKYILNYNYDFIINIIENFQRENSLYLQQKIKNNLVFLIFKLINTKSGTKYKKHYKTWAVNIENRIYEYYKINLDDKSMRTLQLFFDRPEVIDNIKFIDISDKKIENLIFDIKNHFDYIGESLCFTNKDIMLLKNHLKLTFTKIYNGDNIENPLHQEIKKLSPYYYNEVFKVITEFNKKNHNIIPIVEVSYLSLYIVSFSQKLKNKAIFVTSSKGSKKYYLLELLKGNFEWLEFIDPIDLDEFYKGKYSQYIIFSDEKIKGFKYIHIPVSINYEDIKKLESEIKLTKKAYIKLFDKSLFYTNILIRNRNEIIDHMTKKLIDIKYVDIKYLDSVIKREEMESTEIGDLLVLLHGDDKLVNRSSISLCILKEKIKWEYDEVRYVFLISVMAKDYQKYNMRKFYSDLLKMKKEDMLSEIENYNELLEIFYEI